MKRIVGMLLGVTALLLFIVAPAQAAMRVIVARMFGGQVEVVGFHAAKKAPISWQGTEVATSTAGGTFFFHNGAVPASCVGTLSDGVETAYIPVQNCVPTVIPSGVPSPVAVTGQTDCWQSDGESTESCTNTGQDGEIQAGVPFPSPRFKDNGDGTITDNLTGLIWLKDANCPNAARTYDDALGDVKTLNSDGKMNSNDCGDTSNGGTHQTDWRLPNKKELESLVDAQYDDPPLSDAAGTGPGTDSDPFSNFQVGPGYWSSTYFADDPSQAWYLDSEDGPVVPDGKGNSHYVLAVRGGL